MNGSPGHRPCCPVPLVHLVKPEPEQAPNAVGGQTLRVALSGTTVSFFFQSGPETWAISTKGSSAAIFYRLLFMRYSILTNT